MWMVFKLVFLSRLLLHKKNDFLTLKHVLLGNGEREQPDVTDGEPQAWALESGASGGSGLYGWITKYTVSKTSPSVSRPCKNKQARN